MLLALTLGRAAVAQPGPPRPPRPDPAVAVPRHLAHVAAHLAAALPSDDIGRRAMTEARTSFAAAQAALGTNLAAADQLAASCDDLLHAVDGPPPHGPQPQPEEILARIDVMSAVLGTVSGTRVRQLLAFANSVAVGARRKAAAGASDAGWEAARAEGIARAAAHVAIAADPTLGPVLPPPPPRPPKHSKHPHDEPP
ncbi:MAG: hypothetical protein GIW94_11375 [Candidatus Eremiobacteraeota bacterium]|nr:hypothetical protein [Candidatus Eremiobacteraeota bacterium]